MLVDTHTHLFLEQFDEDRHEVVKRSVEAGVEKMLLPNIDVNTIDDMQDLADTFPANCFPMIGLHPCSVKEDFKDQLDLMGKLLEKKTYVAIGETGLDYYWDTNYKKQQQGSLEQHVEWAKKSDLPIVLHTRDSFDDVYRIMKANNDDQLKGVFHCFSGTEEDAKKVIDLGGFKLGIGGVYTFKNSKLDKELSDIPLEHIVLETDSPFLAPHPYRGKRNESAYVKIIAQNMADNKGIDFSEVVRQTTENAVSLFGRL